MYIYNFNACIHTYYVHIYMIACPSLPLGAPRSMSLPFKCSAGFVLDTHKLQMLSAPAQVIG